MINSAIRSHVHRFVHTISETLHFHYDLLSKRHTVRFAKTVNANNNRHISVGTVTENSIW